MKVNMVRVGWNLFFTLLVCIPAFIFLFLKIILLMRETDDSINIINLVIFSGGFGAVLAVLVWLMMKRKEKAVIKGGVALSQYGYNVEIEDNGGGVEKAFYKIDNIYFYCYSPRQKLRKESIEHYMESLAGDIQIIVNIKSNENVVINLIGTRVNGNKLWIRLLDRPLNALKRLIIIDRSGDVKVRR